jgi:hypothetical protein
MGVLPLNFGTGTPIPHSNAQAVVTWIRKAENLNRFFVVQSVVLRFMLTMFDVLLHIVLLI